MQFVEDLQSERVGALPIRDAVCLPGETIIRGAIARMRAANLGCVVIVDVCGRPTGIFTEKSLMDVLLDCDSLDTCTISRYADPSFLAVRHDDSVQEVWDAVQRDGLRFICVVDDNGYPIGVTGQRGLSEYFSDYFPQEVLVQRIGGTPWTSQREGA